MACAMGFVLAPLCGLKKRGGEVDPSVSPEDTQDFLNFLCASVPLCLCGEQKCPCQLF